MSEQFENSVKELLHDMQLDPAPEVWRGVKSRIQPERKRRRFLLWWMLPMVMAGGMLAWWLNGTDESKHTANTQEKASPAAQSPTKPTGDTITTGAAKEVQIQQRGEEEASLKSKGSEVSVVGTPTQRIVLQKKMGKVANRIENEQVKVKPVAPTKKESTTPVVSRKSTAQSNEAKNKETATVVNTPANKPVDTLSVARKVLKSADTSITATSNTPEKKQSSRKWRWGLTAGIGITMPVNGLIGVGGQKSLESVNLPANASNVGANNRLFQRRSGVGGTSWQVGVTTEYSFNRRLIFVGQAGYLQQNFSLTDAVYQDSILQGYRFDALVASTTDQFRFHQLQLYTGLQYQLVEGNGISLSAAAGVSQLWMIRNKQDVTPGAMFTGSQFQTAIGSSGTALRSWQPAIRFGISAGFMNGSSKAISVSPFVQYGLSSYQKNNGASKDHLIQAGVNVSYFFR